MTDINLFLGRIPKSEFPFPLDREAVVDRLEEQAAELAAATGDVLLPTEIAEGYLRIANGNMAEAIRCVSVQRGIDPRHELLVAFGGAAGQHACAIADELGIREIAMHPNAGILSAMGIGMAQVTVHEEAGIYRNLELVDEKTLRAVFAKLESATREQLDAAPDDVAFRRYLDLRFVGLDASMRIPNHRRETITRRTWPNFKRVLVICQTSKTLNV